jgi:hypothetical protein
VRHLAVALTALPLASLAPWSATLVRTPEHMLSPALARILAHPLSSLSTVAPPCRWRVELPTTGSTRALNTLIARVENHLRAPAAICVSGVARDPIVIASKWSAALLWLVGSGPGVVVDPPRLSPALVAPGVSDGTVGAIDVVGSRGVVVANFHIEHVVAAWGTTPAGILVEIAGRNEGVAEASCLLHGDHRCGEVALVDDSVRDVRAPGDTWPPAPRACGSAAIDGYGIEIFDAAPQRSAALENLLLDGVGVADTRVGQSETVAISGNVDGAAVANTSVVGSDNIGIDVEGYYGTSARPRHVALLDNTVVGVDSWTNASYGVRTHRGCMPGAPSAAGIYDDGAAWLLIAHDRVLDTNQGISLDTETAHHESDHVAVLDDTVLDAPNLALPAADQDAIAAAGLTGTLAAGGRAFDALYLDAFGPATRITDVLAAHDLLENDSTFWQARLHQGAAVVVLGGRWSQVMLSDLVARAASASDAPVPLEVDRWPTTWRGTRLACLTLLGGPAGATVATPTSTAASLAEALSAPGDPRGARRALSGCSAERPEYR